MLRIPHCLENRLTGGGKVFFNNCIGCWVDNNADLDGMLQEESHAYVGNRTTDIELIVCHRNQRELHLKVNRLNILI
jgi:hypothetical protein